jgi:hypothetical protein
MFIVSFYKKKQKKKNKQEYHIRIVPKPINRKILETDFYWILSVYYNDY